MTAKKFSKMTVNLYLSTNKYGYYSPCCHGPLYLNKAAQDPAEWGGTHAATARESINLN